MEDDENQKVVEKVLKETKKKGAGKIVLGKMERITKVSRLECTNIYVIFIPFFVRLYQQAV